MGLSVQTRVWGHLRPGADFHPELGQIAFVRDVEKQHWCEGLGGCSMLELGHGEKVWRWAGRRVKEVCGASAGGQRFGQGMRAGSRAGTGCFGEEGQEVEGFYWVWVKDCHSSAASNWLASWWWNACLGDEAYKQLWNTELAEVAKVCAGIETWGLYKLPCEGTLAQKDQTCLPKAENRMSTYQSFECSSCLPSNFLVSWEMWLHANHRFQFVLIWIIGSSIY